MTLYEFKLLDEKELAEALWDRGVHIGERQEGLFKIALYQIDAFYAEVFYHAGYNVIQGIRSFSNVDELEPYLAKIKVTMHE
jgi:hypothetical protein